MPFHTAAKDASEQLSVGNIKGRNSIVSESGNGAVLSESGNSAIVKPELQSFYCTFGGDRIGKYVHIIAKDMDEARACMFENYGKKWAYCYDVHGFVGQVEKYNLQELETLYA